VGNRSTTWRKSCDQTHHHHSSASSKPEAELVNADRHVLESGGLDHLALGRGSIEACWNPADAPVQGKQANRYASPTWGLLATTMTAPPTDQGSHRGEEHGAPQRAPEPGEERCPARTCTRPSRTFDQQTPQAGHPSRRRHNQRYASGFPGQHGEASRPSDQPQSALRRRPPTLLQTPAPHQRRTLGQEPGRLGRAGRLHPADVQTRKSDQVQPGHWLVRADPTPTPGPALHQASPKATTADRPPDVSKQPNVSRATEAGSGDSSSAMRSADDSLA
jgi:hypothetical protein